MSQHVLCRPIAIQPKRTYLSEQKSPGENRLRRRNKIKEKPTRSSAKEISVWLRLTFCGFALRGRLSVNLNKVRKHPIKREFSLTSKSRVAQNRC
jgi:hypothetical protein